MLLPIPQDRAAWLEQRRAYIGGSNIAALFPDLGVAAWSSHYALWHEKRGDVRLPDQSNERAEWGLDLEPFIAAKAAEREGWKVRRGMFAVDDHCPGLACTLDRIISRGPADQAERGLGILELKNVDSIVYAREWIDGEPPPHILLQVQAQLAASGFTWGAVAAFVGGNRLEITRFHPRPAVVAAIRQRVADFWQSVREGSEPEIDGHPSSSRTVRALYRPDLDDEIDLTGDNLAPVLCARLTALAKVRKHIQAKEERIENELREKIGSYRRGYVGGFRVTRSVGQDTPDRPAEPGEMIRGRKGADRLRVTPIKTQAEKPARKRATAEPDNETSQEMAA